MIFNRDIFAAIVTREHEKALEDIELPPDLPLRDYREYEHAIKVPIYPDANEQWSDETGNECNG